MATDALRVTRLVPWLGPWFGIGVVLVAGTLARAESADSDRPLSVIVGASPGPAPMDRLDVARRNVSSVPLPTEHLRVLWTRRLGVIADPPVVRADGTVVVVSPDGEAFILNRDGTDAAQLSVGPGLTSAPAILADGTVLVLNGVGDAVALRGNEVAARVPVFDTATSGVGVQPRPAPQRIVGVHRRGGSPRMRFDLRAAAGSWVLPLEDGGAVVAMGRDLACLDARGGVRSRAFAPVRSVGPILALAGGVALVSEGGQVYTWDLRSAPDAVRARGSFGGAVDGPFAATADGQLVAVVDASRFVALDLTTGELTTWLGGANALTGAFALTSAPVETAILEEMTPTGTRALAVDHEGHALPFAAFLSPEGLRAAPDAGSPGAVAPPAHTALFADPSGKVAFATVDGRVGVASGASKVELGALPCGVPIHSESGSFRRPVRASAGFAGLVPAGRGSFVVACDNGVVALVAGDASD